MSDAKYFQTTKKGEIHELKEDLNHNDAEQRKEAVKKVIAGMTVGKDVSVLFPDVIKCMQTDNVEMKKLVYLYIINYAKTQPDLAILAVNTFVKDSKHHNPLVRALALRTMGCIRVDRITEYLCDPCEHGLVDEDPYVRKTAAITVAKLHDINPSLVESKGMLEKLAGMLSDSNPAVVANAVAALCEVQENTDKVIFKITASTLHKLLAALNECTEWGQVYVLDSLTEYRPSDAREAESIIERVIPRLQHANAGVVLSAVKIILLLMGHVQSTETIRHLHKKLAPPLVTLLSSEPEVQYVALRNISLIVQRAPKILANDVRVFFCKFNDPIYVKIEKLAVLIKLATERNLDQVIQELKEYAREVDINFVKRAVQAIGHCAIKLERGADRCVDALMDLMRTKIPHITQEAVIVIMNIFRRYPDRYEGVLVTLCENLETIEDPTAQAAMLWIIGEYSDKIADTESILFESLENFMDDPVEVQLQLLTASVKLFLKSPKGKSQELVQQVLHHATEDCMNPDIRDRGHVYWRLLASDPDLAKAVVLSERPVIEDSMVAYEPSVLEIMIRNISSLSAVFHKAPETFVVGGRAAVSTFDGDVPEAEPLPADFTEPRAEEPKKKKKSKKAAVEEEAEEEQEEDLGDLLTQTGSTPTHGKAQAKDEEDDLMDLLGGPAPAPAAAPAPSRPANVTMWLQPEAATGGLKLGGSFRRAGGKMYMDIQAMNCGQQPMSGFAVQVNKNSFQLAPDNMQLQLGTLAPQTSGSCSLSFNTGGGMQMQKPLMNLQVAIKNNIGVSYFQCQPPLHMVYVEDGEVGKQEFMGMWKSLEEESKATVEGVTAKSPDALAEQLKAANLFKVAQVKGKEGQCQIYFSAKLVNNIVVLVEVAVWAGGRADIALKVKNQALAEPFHESLKTLLTQ
jgi:AP-1 complex subunit beta-1